MEQLKSTGEALGETLGDQHRSRSQQEDFEWDTRVRILVPESFDSLGPVGNLLNFIQNQYGAGLARLCSFDASCLPLLLDPASQFTQCIEYCYSTQ